MCIETDLNQEVLEYQQTGDSKPLLDKYQNFINKYLRMFAHDVIDFENYDLRYFLSCYLKDKNDIRSLRRGKYHSQEIKSRAYGILHRLKKAFVQHEYNHHHRYHEIESELIVPFLHLAKRFKGTGDFSKYLYGAYRFELKRHLDQLLVTMRDIEDIFFYDSIYSNGIEALEEKMDQPFSIELDDDLKLNDPNWLLGFTAAAPFDSFTREERLILAKYYYEEYTDKEIGQLIGRNPKSINRVRNNLKVKLEKRIHRGEVKWIRLSL
jgi:DNA-directed RNA polymerase specialized sigma24 family protein